MATDEDISRWHDTSTRSLEILARRLGDLDSPKPDAQGLNMLHLAYASRGYAHAAAGNFSDARRAFTCAVTTHIRLYDLFNVDSSAAQAYDRAGNFQTLLMAHATADVELIGSFASRFSLTETALSAGPSDSTFLASVVTALDSRDTDGALHILGNSTPEIDSQFDGYIDCLAAIANRDADGLPSTLERAARKWADFANRNFAGLPRSAFFLDGVAMLHLARVNELQPTIRSADIPIGLLDG